MTLIKCQKNAALNSLTLKIAGAKAPIAPVLNRPLLPLEQLSKLLLHYTNLSLIITGFNSHNTAQLEETFLRKEEIGQDLPHKMLIEDLFIRKFMRGTFPKAIMSEVMIKRQHNLVRVACLISRQAIPARKIYFLLGYTEELMSFFLKCPVKLELQSIESEGDIIFKYI